MKKSALFAIFVVFLFGSAHPDPYPDDYFGSPLGVPLFLSGSFAEMRNNHFHGGLDIKTQGHEGLPVYAAADGWVSRISVAAGGYGNSLYISHPNGYQTVYGHLLRFSEPIASAVRELQEREESFEVQLFPNRDGFPVTKGQQIALSGNTGGSAGPHLHFEVRDERTAEPVNPLLWGFDVTDTIAPRIYRFKVYAVGPTSVVRIRDRVSGGWRTLNPGQDAFIELVRQNGKIVMERVDRIEASGPVAFGVQTHDFHDGSNNLLGQYRIHLDVDGRTLFQSELERFAFDQQRYINAHVDFAERRRSGRWVQRSYVLPGNRLPMYEAENRGILDVLPGTSANLTYRIEDAHGNASGFSFRVDGIESTATAATPPPASYLMHPDESFTLRGSAYTMRAPEGTVYDHVVLDYGTRNAPANSSRPVYSPAIRLHRPDEPVQNAYTLEIRAPELPEHLQSKATLGMLGSNGSVSWAGGSWNGQAVVSNLRTFGEFVVTVDTVGPSIRPLNVQSGSNMSGTGEIRIRIQDDFSGIQSYRGTIDGEWVLFEYDAKFNLLRHRFERDLPRGPHELVLQVEDNKGNMTERRIRFTR
jgi:hypothetical protein